MQDVQVTGVRSETGYLGVPDAGPRLDARSADLGVRWVPI